VPLSNFAPRGFGFVHHSIAILYHQEPNPNITIRNFFIAVGELQSREAQREREAQQQQAAAAAAAAALERRVAELKAAKEAAEHLRDHHCMDSQSKSALLEELQVGQRSAKVANRDFKDFGWRSLNGAVSRRPPISLYTLVPRTGGYAYDVGVWDSSIVQGPLSVAPCLNPRLRFVMFSIWLQVSAEAASRRARDAEAARDAAVLLREAADSEVRASLDSF
jgi:hypothetical protein